MSKTKDVFPVIVQLEIPELWVQAWFPSACLCVRRCCAVIEISCDASSSSSCVKCFILGAGIALWILLMVFLRIMPTIRCWNQTCRFKSWSVAWLTMDCCRDIEECYMDMYLWRIRNSEITSRAMHQMLTSLHNQDWSKHAELIIVPNNSFVLVCILYYLPQSSQCPNIQWRSSRLFKHTDLA